MNKAAFRSLASFPILALALAAPIAIASAASRVESRAMDSAILHRKIRYTAILPPSFDAQKTRTYPILYYLHGLGDNEQSLVAFGGWDIVEQERERGAIGEFIVVTPQGDRSFYINSKDGTTLYEDFFLKEFLPAIEKRYRAGGSRQMRAVSGTSMGGYGALRFAILHPETFAAVAAHMPALVEEMPANLQSGFGSGLNSFGNPFDQRFWKRNTPFALARQSKGLQGLKIYFDCGRQDDYGFDAGAKAFHELLEKLGVKHEFHLDPGRHDGAFVAGHFPASLRFVWRSFGSGKQ